MPIAQERLRSSGSRRSRFVICLPLAIAAMLVTVTLSSNSQAQTVTVLHSFNFRPGDGYNPDAPLIVGPDGTLYGTTYYGGWLNCPGGGGVGCGTVFQEKLVGGQWTYSTIYEFKGGKDGCCNYSVLTLDSAGRLYGTTEAGSYGGIFRLTPGANGKPWRFSILYSFKNQSDGAYPLTPLFIDNLGAIYGVTQSGSLPSCPNGCGAVFQVVPPAKPGGAWTENTLYQFRGGSDGGIPAAMIMDSTGTIYGTTYYDGVVNGSCPTGCGVVFRLTPSASGQWTYSVIFTFKGEPNAVPSFISSGTLLEDGSGALYGLAARVNTGGTDIFRLTPRQNGKWRKTIAHFIASSATYLTAGANGMFYGASMGDRDLDAGNLFQLTPKNGGGFTYKKLVDFNNGPDRNPNGVLVGPSGALFGTLSGGSSDGGAVFEVQ